MAASIRNLTGCLVEIFIAFPDEIGNSKTFEANLQNSRGCPVESHWTSSKILWTSNRNSTGRRASRPDDLGQCSYLSKIELKKNAECILMQECLTVFWIWRPGNMWGNSWSHLYSDGLGFNYLVKVESQNHLVFMILFLKSESTKFKCTHNYWINISKFEM